LTANEITVQNLTANEITVQTETVQVLLTPDNVLYYGAKCDGLTDDSSAFQAALDAKRRIEVPGGTCCINRELIFHQASSLVGNSVGFSYKDTNTQGITVLKWCGASNATAAVLRISTSPVGIEPGTDRLIDTLYGCGVSNLVVDGNGAIGFGIYMVRSGLQGTLDNVVVTNTTRFGFWGTNLWSTVFSRVYARDNQDIGFAVGLNTFSWARNAINDMQFNMIYASGSGISKTYNQTSNPTGGCGLYFGLNRGNELISIDSEGNDGIGIMFELFSGPNIIIGGYVELNTASALLDNRGTQAWGIWVIGSLNGLFNTISHVFLNSNANATLSQNIRLTGTSPSTSRPGGALVLQRLYIGGGVNSDWAMYRMENCAAEITSAITGTLPTATTVLQPGSASKPNHASYDALTTGLFYDSVSFGGTVAGSQMFQCTSALCVMARDNYLGATGTDGSDASLRVRRIGSAVNRFFLQGGTAGGTPTLGTEGTDTDIGMVLQSKGAGNIVLRPGGVTKFTCSSTACTTGTSVPLQQSSIQVVDTLSCTAPLTCSKSGGTYTLTPPLPDTITVAVAGTGSCVGTVSKTGTWAFASISLATGTGSCGGAGSDVFSVTKGSLCSGGATVVCSLTGANEASQRLVWTSVSSTSIMTARIPNPGGSAFSPSTTYLYTVMCGCTSATGV
jgi:hypothetical protein